MKICNQCNSVSGVGMLRLGRKNIELRMRSCSVFLIICAEEMFILISVLWLLIIQHREESYPFVDLLPRENKTTY